MNLLYIHRQHQLMDRYVYIDIIFIGENMNDVVNGITNKELGDVPFMYIYSLTF